MGKPKQATVTASFCDEIESLLANELRLGNVIAQKPYIANWPASGSIFASLEHDFKLPKKDFPANVHLSICNDAHYGWYHEAECTVHKHLLVAGSPKPGLPMWVKAQHQFVGRSRYSALEFVAALQVSPTSSGGRLNLIDLRPAINLSRFGESGARHSARSRRIHGPCDYAQADDNLVASLSYC